MILHEFYTTLTLHALLALVIINIIKTINGVGSVCTKKWLNIFLMKIKEGGQKKKNYKS